MSLDVAMDLAGMATSAGRAITVEADRFECIKIVSFLSLVRFSLIQDIMPFFPSWKALFKQLAKDSPNLQEFSGYSQLGA
jgi:hypothetical protein